MSPLDFALREIVEELVAEALAEQRGLGISAEWVSLEGLAEYLGVSERQVRLLREKGCPARRIGRRLWFSRGEVEDFIAGQERV